MSISTQITVAADAETIVVTAPGALRGPMGDVTPEVTELVERAEAAKDQAGVSAGQAAGSATQAAADAASALDSKTSAMSSAEQASASEIAAKDSEIAAASSEAAAALSETNSAQAAADALASKNAAATSEGNAAASESNAANSAVSASNSATSAAQAAASAAADFENIFQADQVEREEEFDAAQDSREVQFNTFMDASGYEPPIAYAPGILLDRTTKTVTYLGNEYRAKGSLIPFTTSNWATDEAKLKLIGDDSLRQELANATDPSKGLALLGFKQDGADAVARDARHVLAARISPEDYSSFAAAVAYASANGRMLELRDGATYTLTADMLLTAGLMMRGRATIKIGKDVSGIVIAPPVVATTAVTLISTVQYPASTGIEQATALTPSSSVGFARGDVCMLRSADIYPFAASARRAELVKISEIAGGFIYLSGVITGAYSTGITLDKLSNAVVDVDGVTFTYDGDPLAVTSKTRNAAITAIGCVAPRIHVKARDDIADGIRLYSCWQPDVFLHARNLRNNNSLGIFGYGVSCYGACTGGMVRTIADNVRHAYTDGIWISASDYIKDGRCVDMSVYESVAMNTTFASFDTHPGSLNTRFVNCGAVYNQTNTDQPTKDNSYGFQDRGLNTKFEYCWTRGVRVPFYFGSTGQTHGEKNTTRVTGGHFERDGTSVTAFNGGIAKDTTDICEIVIDGAKITGYAPVPVSTAEAILKFHRTEFVGDGTFGLAVTDNSGGVEFTESIFREFVHFRLGKGNPFSFVGCKRYNSGTFIEPFIPGAGSVCTFHDLYVDAPSYGFGNLIRAGQGGDAGAVTLFIGSLFAKNFGNDSAVGSNGVVALTLNNMDIRQKPVKRGPTASRPVLLAGDLGFRYLDNSLAPAGKPITWNGTAWVDATGAVV